MLVQLNDYKGGFLYLRLNVITFKAVLCLGPNVLHLGLYYILDFKRGCAGKDYNPLTLENIWHLISPYSTTAESNIKVMKPIAN